MSPYGRRETLPSNGACISLRAGRGGQDESVLQIQFGLLSAQVLLAVKLAEKASGWTVEFGEASTSLRVQGKAPSERSVYLASGGACNSLRARRASRFGRGVLLASSGASISLRVGRVIRFERGEYLASGGA